MLHCSETERQSDFYEKMLYFENLPLLTIEELESCNPETWLYIVKNSWQEKAAVAATVEDSSSLVMNVTINLKETTQWLENISPEDVLLRESNPCLLSEALSENEKTEKIIDTRTFTRPRKSPLRPVSIPQAVEIENSNLNSTFNQRSISAVKSSGKNCDILSSTVVLEDDENHEHQTDINATFQIDQNDFPEEESLVTACNNNVYHLNSTFPTQNSNRNGVQLPEKISLLNTTYQHAAEEDTPPPQELCADEEDVDVFRKPLLPGAVPKKALMRTSTLNNESPVSAEKDVSPLRAGFGLDDIEKNARLQEESLTQTSTPMGKRSVSAFNRTAAIEPNLGSPISSLCETDRIDRTVNYGTPIRMDDSNSEPALDNSSTKLRGHLTFEKSQHSFDMQSSSPTSPAGSPYSSQSLESDTAVGVSVSTQDLIRRSMPNLNNSTTRMRLPQPTASVGNLNRQHGSQSGLRPPAMLKGVIRPQIATSRVNGSLIRPQLRAAQSQQCQQSHQSQSLVKETLTPSPVILTSLKPALQRLATVGSIPSSSRNSMLPALSRLKAPSSSSVIVKSNASNIIPPPPTSCTAKKVDMNATVVVEKPLASESRALSGIPRPSMSKIPGPRAKSSIPTMAFRPRAPQ